MDLMKKRIYPDNMEIIEAIHFSENYFREHMEVRDGNWYISDYWLIGESRKNFASMVLLKDNYFGPICLDFYAMAMAPCTHDINCMWSGSWNEATNTRDLAYVAGLGGWRDGKIGFEKSPDYKLNCGTKLMDFVPGKVYHIQCGSIGGHVFVIVDGQLAIEATDPEPIDQYVNGRIGFEAYCTRVAFRNLIIRRATYEPIDPVYVPEF